MKPVLEVGPHISAQTWLLGSSQLKRRAAQFSSLLNLNELHWSPKKCSKNSAWMAKDIFLIFFWSICCLRIYIELSTSLLNFNFSQLPSWIFVNNQFLQELDFENFHPSLSHEQYTETACWQKGNFVLIKGHKANALQLLIQTENVQ